MKNKKLLPVIILGTTVLAMMACLLITGIALKPTVTEGQFPFTITYELDGETVTISDIYKVYYDQNDGYSDAKSRVYVGTDDNTLFIIKREGNTRIELYTHFYADYMMGDPAYNYFEEGDIFAPCAYYYDEQEQEYADEEILLAHGFKLISYEYPTPIENSLVFSHFV